MTDNLACLRSLGRVAVVVGFLVIPREALGQG